MLPSPPSPTLLSGAIEVFVSTFNRRKLINNRVCICPVLAGWLLSKRGYFGRLLWRDRNRPGFR